MQPSGKYARGLFFYTTNQGVVGNGAGDRSQ